MLYERTLIGRFVDRPNRFVAHVEVGGTVETVHVKNTGRCRELLTPNAKVCLQKAANPDRKTAYDLISVYKPNLGWVNIDSQACNTVMGEWLQQQDYQLVKPEYTYGRSRIDFYLERTGADGQVARRYLVEVKGCTLEIEGQGFFPDAPSTRAHKHLEELMGAIEAGYQPVIAFVIAMPKVEEVSANLATDPIFGQLLDEAYRAGVEIWYMLCDVEADSLIVREKRMRT